MEIETTTPESIPEAKPKTVQELLEEYSHRIEVEGEPSAEFLIFDLNDQDLLHGLTAPFKKSRHLPEETIASEITIYNPTLVEFKDREVVSGRVELRSSERRSRVMFFEEVDGVWKLIQDAPKLPLQDPFYEPNIEGFQIFGGVKIHPDTLHPRQLGYETVFYRYKDDFSEIHEPPFALGPEKMKDIRLIQIAPERIGVFTRPQGGKFGPGKIGYIEIRHLEELEEKIPQAEILENLLADDEWGGVNDLIILKNGQIGILGHIAQEKEAKKYYYPMAFIFDPDSRRASGLEILATAEDLEKVEPKNRHLGEVIYPGGIKRNPDGTAFIYAGYNDVRAVRFKIKDPFSKYETADLG